MQLNGAHSRGGNGGLSRELDTADPRGRAPAWSSELGGTLEDACGRHVEWSHALPRAQRSIFGLGLVAKSHLHCSMSLLSSRAATVHSLPKSILTHWRFAALASFALARCVVSFARNFAIRAMSRVGTGSESGNRIVPLLSS